MALAPQFPDHARTSTSSTHTTPPSAARLPRWGTPGADGDRCPTPPGPTTDGCVVGGRLSRLAATGNVMTGPEQVLDRGLVPAVSEPFDRRRSSSGRTARCTSAPATARASPSPTTARTAIRSTRAAIRPAASGRSADATDRRGRRAAEPGRAARRGDPVTLDGTGPARRPGHGRGAARQPTRVEPARRERAPDHRRRTAQPVPLHDPARDERALDRRRRLEQLGGDQPHTEPGAAPVENFGWPCYEGDRATRRNTTRPT